ncbi:MAG: ubiquitin-conjugating enzyme E2 [Candidatus Heimdallarchaeaceae archaeon]
MKLFREIIRKVNKISTDDFHLANEMQLVFDKQINFEPVRGNLKQWKGYVGTIEGTEIPIFANIYIQDGFPEIPPFVDITPKVNHPNVDEDGTLSMRLLAEWEPRYHIYQVMIDIKQLFINVPAKTYKTKTKKPKGEQRFSTLPRATIPVKTIPQASFASIDPRIEEERRSIDKTIVNYQDKIEHISRDIEKERKALLKEGGIAVQSRTKEISISLEEDLRAESLAVQDTLEIVQEKFEDGDMTNIDYLKLHKRYTKKGFIAEKQITQVKSSSSGDMTKAEEKILNLEADLFASIATLDNLVRSYEKSEIEQIAYRKQLRALIRGIFKTRLELEKIGFNLDDFVKRENLNNRYQKGIKQLMVVEGEETADTSSIPFDTLKKIPSKTADFVSSAIELIDLTRLRSVARADLIIADIEEMIHILTTFPSIPKDHWVIGDMNNWREIIGKYKPQEIIKEEDCEKLEFQAARWLNDFRRVLKEF